MFYSWQILAKGGPLQVVWMAAHTDPKKLERQKVVAASIPASIESILHPKDPAGRLAKGSGSKGFAASHAASANGGLLQGNGNGDGAEAAPLALRLSGQLLLGVVRVYNKKASLLEGDLSETLERLHREVSAPPETLAKASGWPVAVGKSKKAAGCSNDKGAEVTRGRKGFAPEGDTEALEVAGGSEGGVGGGARRKSKDSLGKSDLENLGGGRGRSRRAEYQEEGAELQEWMAELAAAEEEEVFLRRGSEQFVDGGGGGVHQSIQTPGRLSLGGSTGGHLPLSSRLHHHHHHHQQQQQQQPMWVRGSASLGGSKGFVQGQSGSQLPSAGSQELLVAGGVQGGVAGQGGGLEAGEDEVFEYGGLESEYDLNGLDLSGHEAVLLTQPSAAPSALTDDRLKPQANGHPRLDAAAGDPIETSGADQEDTHRLSEEQRDCSADMLDVGSLEEVEEMMEGRACGGLPATRPLSTVVGPGEATPSNAIFGRHHEILPSAAADAATVAANSQQLELLGSDAGRDPASTQAYKAGRGHLCEAAAVGTSSGGVDRAHRSCNPACLPSPKGQHTATEDGSGRGHSGSARCLLPLFTSLQSAHVIEQKKQQQQQLQQHRKGHVPPPEHCPHSRLGLRRVRMEQSSAGVGGYKVEAQGRVVNTIELPSSVIKQTLRDSRPLLDLARQERCNLHTAFLQPKVPTNVPYQPPSAASDIPPLLLPPPSYYTSPSTYTSAAEGTLRPSMPSEVSAVPELAFVLHESGLCSPSYLLPDLQWLFYEALGWGSQPVGLQPCHQYAQQQQQQQQQQRNERAKCRSQAECPKRTEELVKQRGGPQGAADELQEEGWVGSGGGGQAFPEGGQDEDLHSGGLQQLGQESQVLWGQEEGFEGQEEQEDQQNHHHHCQQQQQQHADEQDGDESKGGGGTQHGFKLGHDVQFEPGVGPSGVLDGFTARTHKLLLHLQQLLLKRGGDSRGDGKHTLGSPTKKRRTQQAENGKGSLHEVSMMRELLAEQLQAAAKAPTPCKRSKAGAGKHASLGNPACLTSSHRICAARTFHDILVLQTGGYVRVKQDSSYGDLCVQEGHKLAS